MIIVMPIIAVMFSSMCVSHSPVNTAETPRREVTRMQIARAPSSLGRIPPALIKISLGSLSRVEYGVFSDIGRLDRLSRWVRPKMLLPVHVRLYAGHTPLRRPLRRLLASAE